MKIFDLLKKYCMDALNIKDAAGKKRYELHYSATDKGGRSYLFVKEAVCTPGELKSVMKKIEDEQKAKGVEMKLMFKRSSGADSAELEKDGYDLGIEMPKGGMTNDPVKVVSVTIKKEPDGASGVVKFTKGKKTFTENKR